MSQTKILSLLAGAGIVLGSAGIASAEMSSDEVRAMVAEMQADANTRSSLLQSGGNAGHDGHFFLSDSEGNFRLNVSGQVQFRYVANFGDMNNPTQLAAGAVADDFTSGFQTRRTKLAFSGNVISKDIFFMVRSEFARAGGGSTLQDAYVGYKFGNGWEMKWGQFKAPFLREELVSSAAQLAGERSLTNELFTGNRTQGIELAYKAEDWRMMFSFNDGFNSANTDFTADGQTFGTPVLYTPTNAGGGSEADFGFTGRAEFKLHGEWGQFKDFTSMAGSEYGLMLGVAGHIESNETTPGFGGASGDVTTFLYTVDLSVEGDGWNFFVAFTGGSSDFDGLADLDASGAGDDIDFDDYGLVVQGGFFIPDTDWEFFARYDIIFPDDDRAMDNEFSTLTFGLNWYWSGHAAKLTLDAVLALDESTGASGNPLAFSAFDSGQGLVGNGDDTEAVLRAQFQLLF